MEVAESKTNEFHLNANGYYVALPFENGRDGKKKENDRETTVSFLLEFPVFELSKFFQFYLSTYKFRLVFIESSVTIQN